LLAISLRQAGHAELHRSIACAQHTKEFFLVAGCSALLVFLAMVVGTWLLLLLLLLVGS